MTQEIESVKPALTVILDDGDFIINSTGAIGKLMAQSVLALTASAKRVTVISDGEMRVMKRNGAVKLNGKALRTAEEQAEVMKPNPSSTGPDIQDQFVGQLERGETGEQAMGESPAPTPGPSDPVPVPVKKRKPVIFQDAAAPPAPELAEAEMDRLLAEAQQAEADAAKLQEDQRFQRQQAVQAAGRGPADQVEPSDVAAEQPAEAAKPRRRERQLATTGRPCGRCGGEGKVMGEAGFVGACPVCQGQGQVKTWDRSLKVR